MNEEIKTSLGRKNCPYQRQRESENLYYTTWKAITTYISKEVNSSTLHELIALRKNLMTLENQLKPTGQSAGNYEFGHIYWRNP